MNIWITHMHIPVLHIWYCTCLYATLRKCYVFGIVYTMALLIASKNLNKTFYKCSVIHQQTLWFANTKHCQQTNLQLPNKPIKKHPMKSWQHLSCTSNTSCFINNESMSYKYKKKYQTKMFVFHSINPSITGLLKQSSICDLCSQMSSSSSFVTPKGLDKWEI